MSSTIFIEIESEREIAALGSDGRGQLRCEGKWLCEGPVDEGNCVARVFDDFSDRIRKRDRMGVLGKYTRSRLIEKYV